jgi:hypothetical protein
VRTLEVQITGKSPGELATVGIGYTLATGRLFCDFAVFQSYAERLLGRPILTHEFATKALWTELREAFEVEVREA